MTQATPNLDHFTTEELIAEAHRRGLTDAAGTFTPRGQAVLAAQRAEQDAATD